jgi:hypothetical protein
MEPPPTPSRSNRRAATLGAVHADKVIAAVKSM